MNDLIILGLTISPWILIPLIYFAWVSFWLLAKRIGFHAMRKFARRTSSRIDDILVRSADLPVTILVFTSGGIVVEKVLPLLTTLQLTNYFLVISRAVTIVAIVLFLDRCSSLFIKEYSSRVDVLKTSGGIARAFVRVIVIGLGFMILLDTFGISVTPLLASLGIGSLAVALALQPTLENLFSGIQLVSDKPIAPGQFIKLESGEEGYVHRIGWRSTWIRMLPNNMVIIPNKVLVNSRVINYYYPDMELAVLVEVGVHYGSDLAQVERVTIEVAKEVMQEVPGGVKEFQPFIRFHTFNDFSVNFSVIMRGKEFVDNYLIKHEFIKRLHKRYEKESIVIPYPIEAVNLDQESRFSTGANLPSELKEKYRKG